jgi:hypothetical protein
VDIFKTLIEKFLDFFNIGRILSILVPGALVSVAFLMLVSLLISLKSECHSNPHKSPTCNKGEVSLADSAVTGIDSKIIQQQATSAACKACITSLAEVNKEPAVRPLPKSATNKDMKSKPKVVDSVKIQQQLTSATCKKWLASLIAAQLNLSPQAPLEKQVINDFLRVKNNPMIIFLLSLVVGILLLEIGKLKIRKMENKYPLFGYADMPNTTANSVGSTAGTTGAKAQPTNTPFIFDTNKPVGLIYFAPYLKDDFITGKENYYSFLIAEHYRFLEFSVVMPPAIIISTFISGAYYLIAAAGYGCIDYLKVALVVIITSAVSLLYAWFNSNVLSRIYDSYQKAASDLITGITDTMNKNLFNKSG